MSCQTTPSRQASRLCRKADLPAEPLNWSGDLVQAYAFVLTGCLGRSRKCRVPHEKACHTTKALPTALLSARVFIAGVVGGFCHHGHVIRSALSGSRRQRSPCE